jgi:hypothetical protein
VTKLGERADQGAADLRVVLDQQQLCHGRYPSPPRPASVIRCPTIELV